MDALQALLGAKPIAEITGTVKIPRLSTEFTIKVVTDDEIQEIRNQAKYPVKNGKRTEFKVNESEASLLVIAKAVVSPDFNDASLKTHYGVQTVGECIKKALLPGEIVKLETEILTLSGFGDLDDEVEEAKN